MMRRAVLFLTGFVLLAQTAWAGPAVQEVKTDSGYTAWLVEDHSLPVVTVKMSFEKSGAAYDPAGKDGTASFLTQMLDEGAGDMDSLAFHQALESNAIRFAAEAGQDMITVSMQTLSEHKDEAMELLLAALTKPRFDEEATARIRASIISDLTALEEEPNYIASRAWKQAAFNGSPYARLRRGTPATVKAITRDDLRLFAKEHFFAGTAPVISVVGDITPEEVREWALPPLAKGAASQAIADITLPDGTDNPVLVKHNVPQTVVLASLPALRRDDPKFYALQVLNHIIGGDSIVSRLGSEVRNKRGLAYHIGSGIEVMDHASFLSASFATRNAQTAEALAIFNSVLQDVRDNGITEQELADAKSFITGSFPLEFDTQNELAGYLIGIQHFHLGIDYLDKRNAYISNVTREEVNALAKQLFAHKPLVVMAGNPENITPTATTP